MQRLVEQPTGDGEVLEGSRRLGRVHYHLSVYQQFSEIENEPVASSLDVEGRLTPLDLFDLSGLRQRRSELTLRLSDGSKHWVLGDGPPAATVTARRRELFRAISGRRSAARIRAYAWDGDPAPYLPVIAPYPLPPDEPARAVAPPAPSGEAPDAKPVARQR